MAQFASDNFAGSSGTELSAYNSAWTEHTSFTTGNCVISDAGRVRRDTTNTSMYYHSGTPATADYSVTANVFTKSANGGNSFAYVVGRLSTSENTAYVALWGGGVTDSWQLQKIIAGTTTTLGSTAGTLAADTSYNIVLEMVGSAIKMYKEGSATPLFSVTDSDITAAGKAGIRLAGGTAETNFVGAHIDNFSANDIVGSTSFALTPRFPRAILNF